MRKFKRETMSWKGLVFATIMLFTVGSGVIFAKKEKPGAILIVQKKDGENVKGELLSVRDGTLTLLIHETACKKTIQLNEISKLWIVKKSAFGRGLLLGGLLGSGLGAMAGFIAGDEFSAAVLAFNLGLAGGVFGGILGVANGRDKYFALDRAVPQKLVWIEAKLASLARFKTDQPSI